MRTTAEMIQVMMACEEGSIIEEQSRLTSGDWHLTKKDHEWDWRYHNYRVRLEAIFGIGDFIRLKDGTIKRANGDDVMHGSLRGTIRWEPIAGDTIVLKHLYTTGVIVTEVVNVDGTLFLKCSRIPLKDCVIVTPYYGQDLRTIL